MKNTVIQENWRKHIKNQSATQSSTFWSKIARIMEVKPLKPLPVQWVHHVLWVQHLRFFVHFHWAHPIPHPVSYHHNRYNIKSNKNSNQRQIVFPERITMGIRFSNFLSSVFHDFSFVKVTYNWLYSFFLFGSTRKKKGINHFSN